MYRKQKKSISGCAIKHFTQKDGKLVDKQNITVHAISFLINYSTHIPFSKHFSGLIFNCFHISGFNIQNILVMKIIMFDILRCITFKMTAKMDVERLHPKSNSVYRSEKCI